jgi:hypothetical protein
VSPENSVGIFANGRLIYVRNQVLVAQEFDADSLRLSGEAAPIATGTVVNATGQVRLSVSDDRGFGLSRELGTPVSAGLV